MTNIGYQRSDRCYPSITSSVHGPPLRKGYREVFSSLKSPLNKVIPPFFPFLKGFHVMKRLWKGNTYLNVALCVRCFGYPTQRYPTTSLPRNRANSSHFCAYTLHYMVVVRYRGTLFFLPFRRQKTTQAALLTTSDFSLKEFLKNEHNYLFVLETA